jgi:outer membrane protein
VKNLSLILNFVLLIAVGVLYFLHFSDKKPGASVEEVQVAEGAEKETPASKSPVDTSALFSGPVDLPAATDPRGTTAYINLDEFFDKYEFYKQGERDIQRSIQNKENQLIREQQKFQEDYQRYEQAAATYTDAQRANREQQLMEQQQQLLALKDKLEYDQTNEMRKFNENLLKKIDEYFRQIARDKNYNYVFTYTKGGPATIVYAKDSLDITKQVVEALNAQYKKKK